MTDTTATFNSGTSLTELTGTRREWKRQIMAAYPTVIDLVILPNGQVKAMNSNHVPFTIGHVSTPRKEA